MLRWLVHLVLIAMLSACAGDRQPESESAGAIHIVREDIAENLPEFSEALEFELAVLDLGDVWGITFVWPEEEPGMVKIGGLPEFFVNKKSLKIEHIQLGM